jgi:SAM-dependent methyltransferase
MSDVLERSIALGAFRATALYQFGQDRVQQALPWDELLSLEAFLRSEYEVRLMPKGFDIRGEIQRRCSPAVVQEHEKVAGRRIRLSQTGETIPSSLNQRFYDLIADQPLAGLTHSIKYPHILDTAAFLTSVVREAGISGAVLDIGCGLGYHACWLARSTGAGRIVGVDRSRPTVANARKIAARMADASRVEFLPGLLSNVALQGPFDLVYSIDGGIEWEEREAWASVERLLGDGGVFVYSGSVDVDRIPPTTMGCVLADALGGWNGWEFDANFVLTFVKGSPSSITGNLKVERDRFWEQQFAPFANSGVAERWKTQAFCRAWKKYGPPPV